MLLIVLPTPIPLLTRKPPSSAASIVSMSGRVLSCGEPFLVIFLKISSSPTLHCLMSSLRLVCISLFSLVVTSSAKMPERQGQHASVLYYN